MANRWGNSGNSSWLYFWGASSHGRWWLPKWRKSIYSIFLQKRNLRCVQTMIFFKTTFSLSSFTFIKRLLSSSSLSAIRVVSSAYLRLLIFLLAILVLACAYSSPVFLMMYSACKLNKQDDNIQPWCTPFPIWNQSVFPCPVLTVASSPAHRFLKRQVRVWYSLLFQNFPWFLVIHTVKGFGIVNKAEIDVFLKLSCIFDDPEDVGNLISGSSAFSKVFQK